MTTQYPKFSNTILFSGDDNNFKTWIRKCDAELDCKCNKF